jgi:hypothetical protein
MSVLEEAGPHIVCVARLEVWLASHTSWPVVRQWQQSVDFEMERIEVKELLIAFINVISDTGCKVKRVAIDTGQQLVDHLVTIVCDSDSVRHS